MAFVTNDISKYNRRNYILYEEQGGGVISSTNGSLFLRLTIRMNY